MAYQRGIGTIASNLEYQQNGDEKINLREEHALGPVPLPGIWESRIAPFLEKYCLFLCICLVGIACARIISTYAALSLTADEPIHFACGLEYVAKHVYRLETQHPPLSRVMQALGPYFFTGARPLDGASNLGIVEIARTGKANLSIFFMRLGNLPFFLLACLVVGAWTWHSFGKATAVLAVGLFTLLPTELADAGLATTDMALGATLGAAFFTAILCGGRPTWLRALLLGLCTALACLSKFTTLGYLPTAVCLALSFYLIACWPGWQGLSRLTMQRLAPLALAGVVAAILIWAAYRFSFGSAIVHGRLVNLPAPEFFDGIRTALHHNQWGHGAYLLGEFRWKGWWYYFLVALAVKTPIAILILSTLGIYVCLKERSRPMYLFPLALILGILLPAMKGHVDIGIRHIEPIYIGLAMVASIGLRQLLQWARTGLTASLTGGLLVGWMVVSVAVYHPDYLAYFNEFAGNSPEKILVDSNYDWGQDLKLLAARLHQMNVKEYSLATYRGVDTKYFETWYGLPPFKDVNNCTPAPGWNVVSSTIEKSLSYWPNIDSRYYRGPETSLKAWYDQIAPNERVGGLLLYNIPSDSKLSGQNCH